MDVVRLIVGTKDHSHYFHARHKTISPQSAWCELPAKRSNASSTASGRRVIRRGLGSTYWNICFNDFSVDDSMKIFTPGSSHSAYIFPGWLCDMVFTMGMGQLEDLSDCQPLIIGVLDNSTMLNSHPSCSQSFISFILVTNLKLPGPKSYPNFISATSCSLECLCIVEHFKEHCLAIHIGF